MKVSVLSDCQIQQLHEASLTILRNVGVHIPHNEALRRFADAGADVDAASQRVRIPEKVISWALETCGKQFTLYGRDHSKRAIFGAGQRNYNTAAGEAFWVEDDSSARRYATLDDVGTAARLVDALPNINIAGAMSDPHELPPEYRCVYVAAELLKNTTKPIMFWFYDRASARFVLELFEIVAGGREQMAQYPIAYPFLEPISPLRFPHDGVDLLFETCQVPLPVPIGPMAQVGATGPGTLAGTLAQENAEILAGLCVVQLIRPGTPVCYGGIPHAFDMRTTQMIFAGPEQALMAVAMTQLGKFYGLPVYINVGLTDSKIADAQAGLEAGITLALGALAGADIFGHLGICGMDQGSSPAILMLQHELIGYVERLARGITLDDDTLGLETIRAVGPGGNYLAEEHTAMHFRNELWFPQLLDRHYFETWSELGRPGMLQRCIDLKNELLRSHTPTPLPDDTQREIDQLLNAAKKHLEK
ncbi:MAG TPA: trimethylamine methyltransferase family protein [Candidatus Hydrogenedentes bacterium]|nr:trimethylamine methyltransferase family protein [Candidatus Hydrogenedentota bacterium]